MQTLKEYRANIDELDEKLVKLLAARFDVCRLVAKYKDQYGIPMMQTDRIREIQERCERLGQTYGVDPGFLQRLFDLVVSESCRLEDEIMSGRRAEAPDA